MKKKILTLMSYVLVAVLASMLTLTLYVRNGEQSKLDQLLALIQQCYVEDTDPVALADAAADAMVTAAGDRWSYYIPAAEYASYVEQSENAYVGIGITIQQREDGEGFDIIKVNEGSSAQEAGILVGDILIAVDGQSVKGADASQPRNLVRGKEGTQVQITVLRDGEEWTYSVTRRQIRTEVATAEMLGDTVGLVTIVNFDERCAQETVAAIESLLAQGVQKLIFDVRNNPGGHANEMVDVLDYLLPEGDLFRTVDYTGKERVDTSDASCLDIPMAVLVNTESYSAAEFFAAALQQYDAALVVGEHTSGKGYFQYTYRLNDGSAVALSSGKYYTPKGFTLEGVGIEPDIAVTLEEEHFLQLYAGTLPHEEDAQLQAALAALEE